MALVRSESTFFNRLLRFLDRFPAKIRNDEQQKMSFEYENMNMSVVNVNRNRSDKDWFTIPSNSETDDRSTIIEVNLRVLQETLNSSEGYRIIETIFSNFNLFPQTNRTSLGIPISYQIANYSSLLAQDDLVRFQIRVPQVGWGSIRKLVDLVWYRSLLGSTITEHLLCVLVIQGEQRLMDGGW